MSTQNLRMPKQKRPRPRLQKPRRETMTMTMMPRRSKHRRCWSQSLAPKKMREWSWMCGYAIGLGESGVQWLKDTGILRIQNEYSVDGTPKTTSPPKSQSFCRRGKSFTNSHIPASPINVLSSGKPAQTGANGIGFVFVRFPAFNWRNYGIIAHNIEDLIVSSLFPDFQVETHFTRRNPSSAWRAKSSRFLLWDAVLVQSNTMQHSSMFLPCDVFHWFRVGRVMPLLSSFYTCSMRTGKHVGVKWASLSRWHAYCQKKPLKKRHRSGFSPVPEIPHIWASPILSSSKSGGDDEH